MKKNNSPNMYDPSIYHEMVDNPLPPLTLRIGITGHRLLPVAQLKQLSKSICATYQAIDDVIKQLISEDEEIVATLYTGNTETKPIIRIISSLAEGADRLCIKPELFPSGREQEVCCDYELAYILPFLKKEYENDFNAESKAEFNDILNRVGNDSQIAQIIELDGDPGQRTQAYNDCSRVLVAHSDLLIAIYNGDNSKNQGTAAAVNAARKKGIPVIHISTLDTTRRFHYTDRNWNNRTEIFTPHALRLELRRILMFSDILDHSKTDQGETPKQKILARFIRYKGGENLEFTPETNNVDFDNAGPIELKKEYESELAKVFTTLKNMIATPQKKEAASSLYFPEIETQAATTEKKKNFSAKQPMPSLNRYFAAYLRADRLANYYSHIHRSTYVLIYLLGAAALIIAACALAFKKDHATVLILVLVLFELALLFAIYRLYWRDNIKNKYHERWLEYRFLAEFLRTTCYLSLVGRPYSIANSHNTLEFHDRNMIGHSTIERSWLYIYTETINRWAGFNTCHLDPLYISKVNTFVIDTWLNGQINYHKDNAITMHVLGKELSKVSFWLFKATVVIVTLKFIFTGSFIVFRIAPDTISVFFSYVLSLGAAILPILATTAFAIRNHAEFDISAQRSKTMYAALDFKQKKMESNAILTSSQVATNLNEIAAITTKETADWLEIYEVKESELG